MFEKHLLIDGKSFSKTHQINAKRPTEYWLTFIKRYVLTYKKPWFYWHYLIFLIPVIAFIILIVIEADSDTVFPVLFVTGFVSIFVFIFAMARANQPFVPINGFLELAKFIISIKGDIYRNRFSLHLNSSVIEKSINLLNPNDIGLAKRHRTVFKPFQLQRFKANFILKDGSICNVALHQITLRVTTTKRRSSGKTKTKMKRKHKLFYLLNLKLKNENYSVYNADPAIMVTDKFEVSLLTENGFHFVKIKSKVKSLQISSKLETRNQHEPSIYTEMMEYLMNNKIVLPINAKKLIQ